MAMKGKGWGAHKVASAKGKEPRWNPHKNNRHFPHQRYTFPTPETPNDQ